MNALVIGAGLAGLTAARALTARGHAVQVVDKGGAPGGRLATRRIVDGDADRPEHASLAFDHGAQYFTVRDARFAAEVEAWHKARVVQVWHGKLASFDSEGREAVADDHTRWVGVPGMSAIAQAPCARPRRALRRPGGDTGTRRRRSRRAISGGSHRGRIAGPVRRGHPRRPSPTSDAARLHLTGAHRGHRPGARYTRAGLRSSRSTTA